MQKTQAAYTVTPPKQPRPRAARSVCDRRQRRPGVVAQETLRIPGAGAEPAAWQPEDCALVMFSMYLDLQGNAFDHESKLGLMHDLLPEPMFDFVAPRGTEWDVPLQGEAAMPAEFQAPTVSTPGGKIRWPGTCSCRRAGRLASTPFIPAATIGPSRASSPPTAGRCR